MFCRHVFGNISGGFRGISRFLGNFAEIPEFRGSATARNIRSPVKLTEKIIRENAFEQKKKKPGLNLTLGYELISLRTTGPG